MLEGDVQECLFGEGEFSGGGSIFSRGMYRAMSRGCILRGCLRGCPGVFVRRGGIFFGRR